MNRLLDVKSFFRFLGKNRFYTLINVFGLSVSLMFVILIAVYTTQELSVDAFHEKGDRIYVMGTETYPGSAYKLGARVEEHYPEVEKACGVVSMQKGLPVKIDDRKLKADMAYAEDSFFDLFSFPLVSGDRSRVLAAPDGAVISESFARRAFPDSDPMGQRIQVYDSLTVTVRGVMADIRRSTIPYADILLRIENVDYYNSGMSSDTYNNFGSAVVFLLAGEGADLRARANDMRDWFKEFVWIYRDEHTREVVLTPLKEIYFTELYPMFSNGSFNGMLLSFGNRSFVRILMWTGILILLFAVINYINLTVAQAGFRAKEMATRRLLGSSRGELFARLMTESTLLCAISFAAGLTLAFAAAPYAGNLVERTLDMQGAATPASIAAAAGLVAVLGIVSGLLPAAVISNARAVEVVRGSFSRKTKMVFSKIFITFQNAVTIVMVAASITMIAQVQHLVSAPLGYHTENLIDIPLSDENLSPDAKRLLAGELERLPAVRRTGFGAGTPFDRGNNHTMRMKDKNISFQSFICDTAFFNMLGWEKLRDNQVSGDAFYLNERALAELEIEQDAPVFPFYDREMPLAGVLRDFQLYNITGPPSPVMVQVKAPHEFNDWERWTLLVEVEGSPAAAWGAVKETFERITGSEFRGQFIDQQVAASFEGEQRTSRLMTLFTAIAIVISLLGLVAMSTYFIRLRAKEIAVRKVFGSTNPEALRRLVATFLSYVLIAFVVAAPAAWVMMRQWLAGYAYRIELSPWFFVVAGVFCLAVSFVTVFFQSYAAANANPVNSIKTE
ncbi:MAG: ABC transporter permease [Tannerella sp.]|jgi:putative ABC transport system permease protein|nr:ABC transporter permease [Tannerella sp.]